MIDKSLWLVLLHLVIQGVVIVRVLQRPNREPTSRIAWMVVVLALPVLGILAYLMLGETNVGRRNQKAMQRVMGGELHRQTVQESLAKDPVSVPIRYAHLFRGWLCATT
jgi:cardiolipin synthase